MKRGTMEITIFLILLAIALPIGLWIGLSTDKRQGMNNEQWKAYNEKQKRMEEMQEILDELKGEQNE